jgi:hypothetical protein
MLILTLYFILGDVALEMETGLSNINEDKRHRTYNSVALFLRVLKLNIRLRHTSTGNPA